MRSKIYFGLGALLITYAVFGRWSDRPVHPQAGVLAAAEPVQTAVENIAPLEKNGFTIKPLARYEITARVLSKERYRWDAGAKLAPVDLAVGWGPMSDSAVLDKLKISQDTRWYNWSADVLPIPNDEINRHAANMHLIAADNDIAQQIRQVRAGKIITLRGYLVEVRGENGFTWKSSLTREDSGSGACELMWVESFSVQ